MRALGRKVTATRAAHPSGYGREVTGCRFSRKTASGEFPARDLRFTPSAPLVVSHPSPARETDAHQGPGRGSTFPVDSNRPLRQKVVQQLQVICSLFCPHPEVSGLGLRSSREPPGNGEPSLHYPGVVRGPRVLGTADSRHKGLCGSTLLRSVIRWEIHRPKTITAIRCHA